LLDTSSYYLQHMGIALHLTCHNVYALQCSMQHQSVKPPVKELEN